MSFICVECAKDQNLKHFIENRGITGDCTICQNNAVKVVDYENDEFFQLIKSILRFNYSEWEYNTHLGGDGYDKLFYGDKNIFFNESRAVSEEIYEDLVLFITDGDVYEGYDKGISIFSGYNKYEMRNMPLVSIKSSYSKDITKLSSRLKTENYFDLEGELKAIIDNYSTSAMTVYSKGSYFYRARIGVSDKKRSFSGGFETELHYEPYKNGEIGAPPPQFASSGRINRLGVSFMYCATDKYTAISEVRPHPGDFVSTGKFSLRKDVRVFDLSKSLLLEYFHCDESLDKYVPFQNLVDLINKVVPPSERQHYSITQLIADCIRQLGFDGIAFRSTVGEGINLVFFQSSILEFMNDENEVVCIKQVKYDYDPVPIIQKDYLYQ
ncbi:RES domain-containing protein [Photobacterium carnosum]|uniref:RES family NAD+ phosphorylase n=1 Tax=Photobacterium carnosum TaxID=2023717 RepID=UPI001E28EF04|nr:RES domain-containing protein [Photobacterium carnosum]